MLETFFLNSINFSGFKLIFKSFRLLDEEKDLSDFGEDVVESDDLEQEIKDTTDINKTKSFSIKTP